ncbi:hypothetical protein TM239_04350 [Bradyrhizobium sp. TM239]|nr:hypothetical protein TM239_04350 [Bradyrhizobium sp. TM239]
MCREDIARSLASFMAGTPPHSRGAFRPSFAWLRAPIGREGAGKAGSRLAPVAACAKGSLRVQAQAEDHRATGTSRPSLRDGWNGLCRALPGERCTIAPVTSRITDTPARLGRSCHRKTWRQNPGRQDHTILPYTRLTRRKRAVSLTVARPAKPLAPMGPVSTAVRPHVVTIAIRPLRGPE